MTYEVISTGSKGNAVLLNNSILVDIGITYKALSKYTRKIKLLLLTHSHSDHINTTTVKKLLKERPNIRIACCSWMLDKLYEAKVTDDKIDILELGKTYNYGSFSVVADMTTHNVPNCCFHFNFNGEKVFYATDTGNLDNIEAKNYNLYLIEANYTEADIERRIAEKEKNGEFVYEYSVLQNHLSMEQAQSWLIDNASKFSKYFFLHQHEEVKPKPKRKKVAIL